MSTQTFFWDRIADSYANRPVADEMSYQAKLEHTQKLLTLESNVLEFGCGTGSTAIHHAPHVRRVLATDVSERMLNFAREKAALANLSNIGFEQTTLMDLDSPDAAWDVLLGMSILHLLPDKDQHIARAYKLLKPGGVFVSSTACIADMNTGFKLIAPILRLMPLMPKVQAFSKTSLIQSFDNAGFSIDYEWQPERDKAVFVVARKPNNF